MPKIPNFLWKPLILPFCVLAVVCLFLARVVVCWSGIFSQEPTVNWERVTKAAQTYFSFPSTENAFELYSVLPRTQFRSDDKDFSKGSAYLKTHYYIFENLPILERQVLKADKNAVKVAVRLWTISDAGFSEALCDILGSLIMVDPKMFLEEFSYSPGTYEEIVDRLGSTVCRGGILDPTKRDFKGKAVREELEMRIKALETVNSSDLLVIKLRNEGISIIKGRCGEPRESASLNSSTAQENKKQNIDWTKVREAFGAYCEFPSADNARRILAALPNALANREADFEQWSAAVDYVYEGPPFRVLDNLVRKGDKFALRVAFKTLFMSDGAFGENLCGLIGRAIRVNPIVFLEEAKIFSKYKDWSLLNGSILAGNIDADDYRPEVVNKEIQLRIKALKTVDRADLLEIRDICISELKTSLNIGGGKEKY